MNWTDHFAKRTQNMKPSTIREILKLTQRSEVISFAGGLPAPHLFPVNELQQAAEKVLSERGAEALQYSTTEGYLPLREWVASRFEGMSTENVQVVSGSQQGLDLVGKCFLNPGDKVVVSAPTYMGALRAFDPYEPEYLTVECDDEGMLPEALEQALTRNPKLLYVIPNFDNPTGITMSLARRKRLLELAERFDVPIYEDDPYGELRFEGEELPRLVDLAPERVIYAGTFSKIVVPGFRTAWLVAPADALLPIGRAKQAADLHTSTYTQMIAYEVLSSGFLDAQVGRVREYYKKQRDLMLAALDAHFPDDLTWTRPKGGMFLWVTLPDGVDATELAYEAVEQNVAYVPGEAFFADGTGKNTLRLSYSVATPEQIEAGMERLGQVFKKHLTTATV